MLAWRRPRSRFRPARFRHHQRCSLSSGPPFGLRRLPTTSYCSHGRRPGFLRRSFAACSSRQFAHWMASSAAAVCDVGLLSIVRPLSRLPFDVQVVTEPCSRTAHASLAEYRKLYDARRKVFAFFCLINLVTRSSSVNVFAMTASSSYVFSRLPFLVWYTDTRVRTSGDHESHKEHRTASASSYVCLRASRACGVTADVSHHSAPPDRSTWESGRPSWRQS